MSTPNPLDCKLEGLELYAPRKTRTQPQESDDLPPPAVANEAPPAEEGGPWPAGPDPAQIAHARVDGAIQAAVDLAREAPGQQSAEHAARLPPTANLRPPQREAADWTPSSSANSRRDQDRAQHASLRSRLEPEIVPEPIGMQRRFDFAMLARFALAVGVAAAVAYGVVLISLSQSGGRLGGRADGPLAAVAPTLPDDTAALRPQAQLVVKNQHALANEPLSLSVFVERARGHESVLLAGLRAGTWLSAGAPVSDSRWKLPSDDLGNLYVYPPKDFVGVMNTAFDLLSPDARLLDSRAVRLEWIAKESHTVRPAALKPIIVKPAAAPKPASPSIASIQPMDEQEAAMLMQRGKDLLNQGDIAAARLAFRRLADAGNAEAALVLAMTFDPRYLAEHNVIGITGDMATARKWYQRAMELGSPEAKHVLAETAAN